MENLMASKRKQVIFSKYSWTEGFAKVTQNEPPRCALNRS